MKTIIAVLAFMICVQYTHAQVESQRPIKSNVSLDKTPIRIPGKKGGHSTNPKYGRTADKGDKYSFETWIDDNEVLHFSCSGDVSSAVLQVFTAEQLAVRKGTDHTYPFSKPVHEYQFKLTAPAYKDFYAYWIHVYTADGVHYEGYFKRL